MVDLKIRLPDNVLEAAERNQFSLTGKNHTEFLKSQWLVFLHDRMNETEKSYYKISDLTSYFLNWIRNKHPKNGTHQQSSSGNSRTKRNNGAYKLLDKLKEELASGDVEGV